MSCGEVVGESVDWSKDEVSDYDSIHKETRGEIED